MTAEPQRPVFVGGTGRSGTTIAGRLIGHFADIRLTRPREIRFTSAAKGLLDAFETHIAGITSDGRRVSAEEAVARIRGPWFRRPKPSGFVGGISLAIDEEPLRIATERYLDEFSDDPAAATRRLTESIVSAKVKPQRPTRWVDTTPANARRAATLIAVFPDARVVHMTRDGRDVAMSFVRQPFGPSDPMTALEAWFERMSQALVSEAQAPSGSVMRLSLAALADQDRAASLERLGAFLDLSVTPDVQQWFDTEVAPEQAREGRWRGSADPSLAAELDSRYAEMLAELTRVTADPFTSREG